MPFLDLPNELLLSVADNLERERDINSVARTNRRLHFLFNPYLYRHDAQRGNSWALLWAAQQGQEKTAQISLHEGADFRKMQTIFANGTALRCTALHIASLHGAAPIVRLLLEKGADVEARDDKLQTPLHYAMKSRMENWAANISTVRYLIENNANKYARDRLGRLPQDIAEEKMMITFGEAVA